MINTIDFPSSIERKNRLFIILWSIGITMGILIFSVHFVRKYGIIKVSDWLTGYFFVLSLLYILIPLRI